MQCIVRDCGEYFIIRKWRVGILINFYMLLGIIKFVDLIVFLYLLLFGIKIQLVIEVVMVNILIIGVVDSDCNFNFIMYLIFGNDDSLFVVELYCDLFKKVVLKVKELRKIKEEGGKELGEIQL